MQGSEMEEADKSLPLCFKNSLTKYNVLSKYNIKKRTLVI